MKLKNITVSGFKSFVDQTDIIFNQGIVGVIGPNGCGKSNVIDAVRWVMGESSAKMLRGDSLEDVIFNGSSVRKAVGRASVELAFDNSLGRIKGNYKPFSEIVVKRILSRDGQSQYRLNDKRVRRKDVLDLFRGTGLGPRSYSIIEQGMVSRIVEARPDELRSYVEEAAGISRYKEKRRETENRIRHTLDNIERSEDIRDELLAQLRKLKRQAQAAERFKKLQAKRRDVQALHYRRRFDAFESEIESVAEKLNESANLLEKYKASQRETEAEIEVSRSEQGQAQDALVDIQASYYQAGAEISKVEQKIEHIKASEAQDAKALAEVNEALLEFKHQTHADEVMLADYQLELDHLLQNLADDEITLSKTLITAEQAQEAFNKWQRKFTQHRQAYQSEANTKQLQMSIIDQINRQQGRADDRQKQLEAEQVELKEKLANKGKLPLEEMLKTTQSQYDQLNLQTEQAEQGKRKAFEQSASIKNQLGEHRALKGTLQSRVKSLEEFQSAALTSQHSDYKRWLGNSNLAKTDLLATQLRIEKGWERAADRVLGASLNARIDRSGQHTFWLEPAEHAIKLISIDLIKPNDREFKLEALSKYVSAKDVDISAIVAGVYVAEDAAQAQKYRLKLEHGERIVTRDGALFGANWVSHAGEAAANTGYLVREEEVNALKTRLNELEAGISDLKIALASAQESEQRSQAQAKQLRAQLDLTRRELSDTQSQITKLDIAQEYTQSRLLSLTEELNEIKKHSEQETTRLDEAQSKLAVVTQALGVTGHNQNELAQKERRVKSDIETARLAHREQQALVQSKKLDQTRLETSVLSLRNGLDRMRQQISQQELRKQDLLKKSSISTGPLDSLNETLQAHLVNHKEIEKALATSRDEIATFETCLRAQQAQLVTIKERVAVAHTTLDRARMSMQECKIRQQSLVDEATRDGCVINDVTLPEACPSIDDCAFQISDLERKISSIGAVNLVAIDEYETQSERAEYLEKQHEDLRRALETLEKVIRKIDKETRQRFEQTFTKLNDCFSGYFPKLFGGGKASLALTSDDFLTTGVSVMAQPPGKRNSTINLLSGGEKALTAVSLLFALFELNPAPFCMMDEVDAPLDDANVDRFCDTLKSLSKHAQIIVITHNKITMQAARHLVGVTMHEPGVSRIVSVDVEQAMEMVGE